VRPGRAADLPGLLEVHRGLVREGVFNATPTRGWFERMLGDFDWAARSRVVEEGGRLAAGVIVFDRPVSEGTLARAEVIAGPELLVPLADWGIALGRAAGAWGVQVWRGRGHGGGLERTGLRRARHFWRMDRPNLLAVPALPLAAGYRLVDGGDASITESQWLEVTEGSFAEHWRHTPTTLVALHRRRSAAGYSPQLELMALDLDGRPAAFVSAGVEGYEDDRRPQPVGLVVMVGTLPQHRRRGLAAALVAEAMRRLRAAGARSSSLYVDGLNATRAFDVYRRLGYEVGFEEEVWETAFS
jgi:ribosomal protein S18 acetylase RimI-like enzyme